MNGSYNYLLGSSMLVYGGTAAGVFASYITLDLDTMIITKPFHNFKILKKCMIVIYIC